VAYSLIPVLLLFALAEGVCRLFPHEDTGRVGGGFVEPDPDLIWRLRPFESGPLETNELGFRDGPYRAEADLTVLVLGDSVSWGDGVTNPTLIYPFLLERALSAREGFGLVEVVNASVPGYSTFQQLRYLERDGLALEPDLVLLQVCLNDVVERYDALAEYGGNNVFLGVDTRATVHGARGWLLRHSRAFELATRFLQNRARGQQDFTVQGLASDELHDGLQEAWDTFLSEVSAIKALADQAAVPFAVMIAPYRFQTEASETLRQPQDRLLAHCESLAIDCLDLLPEFASARTPAQGPLFNDQNHFSERGHQLVASLLDAWLADLLR